MPVEYIKCWPWRWYHYLLHSLRHYDKNIVIWKLFVYVSIIKLLNTEQNQQ